MALAGRRTATRPESGESPGIRTAEVRPPSESDETTWVFLSGAFIVLCVIYVVAFQRLGRPAGPSPGQATTLPFQVLFADLPGPEQREFRQMQEGLAEALVARGRNGAWPATEALAKDGIPPFATDVLDKSGLRWSQRRDGLTFQYVGIPAAGADATAYMIVVQEPDPVAGEKPDPKAAVDEEHRLLPDGTLLHVTYWKRSAGAVAPGVVAEPALAGWTQIRVTSPFAEVEMEKP